MMQRMSASDDRVREAVRGIFTKAAFLTYLGIEFDDAGPGWCRARLQVQPEQRQQHGYVHAGVIATLADHVAGGAARSVVGEAADVITIEFKINFLHAAKGELLVATGKVLKAGQRIVIAESEVYSGETIVAKCMETLAVQTPR
jgi:uncharacterized protein (TIGR00369 family)